MADDTVKESERGRMVAAFWRQATEGLRDETDNIKENFRFYCGGNGQWDSDVIAQLDEEGKPHLSINKCKGTIDLLSGYQRKFRDDVKLFPRRGGTSQVARVLTRMSAHSMDIAKPNGDMVLSEQFLMGAIGGKSWVEIGNDYSYDQIGGDIQPRELSVFEVLEDPLFRGYDINSTDPYNFNRFIFKLMFLDEEQIKLIYPDAKDQIDYIAQAAGQDWEFAGHVLGGTGDGANSASDDYDYGNRQAERTWIPDMANIIGEYQRYLVRQCWYRKFEAVVSVVNQQTGKVFEFGDKVSQAKALADKMPSVVAIVRLIPKLYRCTYIGDIELEYEENPLNNIHEYPFFRYSPYWLDGKPMGELDNLKDPQMELNKRRSQLLHHLNSTANGGHWVEEDSLPDGELSNLENNSSRSDFIGVYRKGTTPPDRIIPSPLSDGHLKLALLSSQDFEDITKLNDAVYGQLQGAKESGEALKTRRDQGMMGKEVAFDNFSFTQLSFYSHLVERIRQPDKNGNFVYSEEEILQIIEEEDMQVDREQLRDISTGRYGFKVGKAENQPTERQRSFQELMALIQALPEQARELDIINILEMSDMNAKDKLIQSIQTARQRFAQQQAQMQSQQQQLPAGVA